MTKEPCRDGILNAMSRRIEQFKDECRFWEESMSYLLLENLHMKTRLGAVIPYIDKDAMDEVEHYQNLFLTKDMAMALYRKDIFEHRQLLARATADGDIAQHIKAGQNRLRTDIRRLEQDCSNLKFDFNAYLESVLG